MKPNNRIIQERRKHPRIETVLPLQIKTEGFDIVTSTKNISCAGAYCQIGKFLEPLTKLDIVLVLDNQKRGAERQIARVKCKGVVVRTEPIQSSETEKKFNIAIYFNDISESEKQKIAGFIKSLIML